MSNCNSNPLSRATFQQVYFTILFSHFAQINFRRQNLNPCTSEILLQTEKFSPSKRFFLLRDEILRVVCFAVFSRFREQQQLTVGSHYARFSTRSQRQGLRETCFASVRRAVGFESLAGENFRWKIRKIEHFFGCSDSFINTRVF